MANNTGTNSNTLTVEEVVGRPFSTVALVELEKPPKAERVLVTDLAIFANLLRPP